MRRFANRFFWISLALVSVPGLFCFCLVQPTLKTGYPSRLHVDIQRLKHHVKTLTVDYYPRNHTNIARLDQTASYIESQFQRYGARVQIQEFEVEGKKYRNIIGRYGSGRGRRMIVGAHYDSCIGTPGADDNASGVTSLLEIASLLGQEGANRNVDLVAYSLEEPPYFGTENMGSFIHANRIADKNDIEGVIVLEMIGHFTTDPNSQSYPIGLLKLLYPDRGDFIAIVGNMSQPTFTRKVKARMKGATDLPVYSINAPAGMPGIDFSDHRNYWKYGMNAMMITDTAFYRNREYHKAGDTYDKLDYDKMAKVVAAVYEVIR